MPCKPFLLPLGVFFLTAPLSAAPPNDGKLENIVYGQAGGHDLKLDLYLPTTPAPARGKGRPVVIYIHSGGWRVGSKAEGGRYAKLFTDNGIAFASIDYRLSGEAIWPAQILDSKTAVRWTRANARRYGLDPARIGAFGASAGGHLVALLGTTEGVKALEDLGEGSPQASSRVQAVCDVSGPVDLSIPTHSLIGKLAVSGEMHATPQENPALYRQTNPALYVKGGEPPFLIVQGDADKLVLPKNALLLEAALKAHGDRVTVDMVPGGKHIPLEGEPQLREIIVFFMRHLG